MELDRGDERDVRSWQKADLNAKAEDCGLRVQSRLASNG
jgi:hypothetical protein